jgi:glutamate carboxypeptidase
MPLDAKQLLDYFNTRLPAMLDAIRRVVEEETPSGDKARLDAFAARLAQRYTEAGAVATLIANPDAGDHIQVQLMPANVAGQPPGLVLCHYDTVWPVGSLATHPFRIEEGKAYGPGIFDMQSSLVLVDFALQALRDLGLTPPRPLHILITSDEEVGSTTSRAHIEAAARAAAYVLVLESPLPGGVLKTARKGVGEFWLEITGRAAHAGVEPEKGIHAVEEAAHQILRLHALNNPAAGTTVSVGVIAGGSASNVIPAQVRMEIDTRTWSQSEADRVEQAIRGLQPEVPGAQLAIRGGWNRPPLERSATQALYERVRALGEALGMELGEGNTGGGSDGNFTGALGVPTLDGLGVPGAGAHADHEHIEVERIAASAALLVAMWMEL